MRTVVRHRGHTAVEAAIYATASTKSYVDANLRIARSAKAGEAVTPISTPKASVAIPKAHSAGKMCRRERWACVAALSGRAALRVNAIR